MGRPKVLKPKTRLHHIEKHVKTLRTKGTPTLRLWGKKFSLLTPIEYLGNSNWLCQCDCGNQTVVPTLRLTHSRTQSCGCFHSAWHKANWAAAKQEGFTNLKSYLIAKKGKPRIKLLEEPPREG